MGEMGKIRLIPTGTGQLLRQPPDDDIIVSTCR